MEGISALTGPPRVYHSIVLLLSFVRAFPNSWTTFAGPFVAPDVDHWCSKPDLPFLGNWTEQQWKESALPVADKSGERGKENYESCRMFPIIWDGGNGTDVSFDNSTTVPCNSWTYNESLPGSSAVPEVCRFCIQCPRTH
ncbi:hypothetical protein HPB48_009885 [Haemaphysalis longicornis]|uniref:Uncharacterized protein n=1 Tax=Haemaphysalis longicornis TaxID=44386 RepID=A0A9J6GCK7_HAELO|nr:hypothetical protein HPB48_009885 [Haemaphysalis longicornis]